MIIRSFKKCSITTNIDDSENSQVNICILEDYVTFAPDKEFHLETSLSEESEDEEWVTTTMVILITVVPMILKKAMSHMMKMKINMN